MIPAPRRTPFSDVPIEGRAGDRDILCPWCGYNLAGLAEGACPECGRRSGPEEAIAAAARSRLLAGARRICLRFFALPLAIAIALSVLALWRSPLPVALAILSAGIALPVLALAAGAPAVLLSRHWERDAVLLTWMHHAWWLMLAWIALPGVALLAAFGWILFGLDAAPIPLVLVVVAPPWATVAIVGILAWAGAWFEGERRLKHRPRLRALAIFIGAGVTLLGAVVAALWTGLALGAPYLVLMD